MTCIADASCLSVVPRLLSDPDEKVQEFGGRLFNVLVFDDLEDEDEAQPLLDWLRNHGDERVRKLGDWADEFLFAPAVTRSSLLWSTIVR